VLGGTFDPVHNGHLEAAGGLLKAARLVEVWLMPNAQPPHREQPLASASQRFDMVELAVADHPGMVASRLELDRGGRSYTIDTVRELRQRYPARRFEVLLGADAAKQIRSWYEADALLAEAAFVIFSRPGTGLDDAELRALGFSEERTRVVALHTEDIAAQEIRRRLGARESIEGLVPSAVAAYIRRHHLYGT
jgi:nicotinate-nucleotide adenylyltransferase